MRISNMAKEILTSEMIDEFIDAELTYKEESEIRDLFAGYCDWWETLIANIDGESDEEPERIVCKCFKNRYELIEEMDAGYKILSSMYDDITECEVFAMVKVIDDYDDVVEAFLALSVVLGCIESLQG